MEVSGVKHAFSLLVARHADHLANEAVQQAAYYSIIVIIIIIKIILNSFGSWHYMLQVQPNNYATFYDDQTQNWSMMFETSEDAIDFAREVCTEKSL